MASIHAAETQRAGEGLPQNLEGPGLATKTRVCILLISLLIGLDFRVVHSWSTRDPKSALADDLGILLRLCCLSASARGQSSVESPLPSLKIADDDSLPGPKTSLGLRCSVLGVQTNTILTPHPK